MGEKKKADAPSKDVDLEQAQEQLGSMKERLENLNVQVQKMSAKYNSPLKEEQVATITKRDVEKHHGNVPLLYERTGRMFTLRPREEILSSLSESELDAKKEAERLKVAVAQMQIKFNQEKAVFQQMFTEVAKTAQAQKAE